MTQFAFQVPWVILLGIPVVAAVMVWSAIRLRRQQIGTRRLATLIAIRSVFLTALVLLIARPVWTSPDRQDEVRNQVALLIDCSESMSVREGEQTRYHQAVEFAVELLFVVFVEVAQTCHVDGDDADDSGHLRASEKPAAAF